MKAVLRDIRRFPYLTVAWVLLITLIAVGFQRQEGLTGRVELESRIQAYQNCNAVNSGNDAVLKMTMALREFARNQSDLEGGEDEQTEAARDAFVEDVEESLDYQDCPPNPWLGDSRPNGAEDE